MELSIIEKDPDANYDLLSTDDSDILNTFNDSTEIKNDSLYVFEGINELSNQFRFIKFLVLFIMLNPLVRLILMFLNKNIYDNRLIDTLLSKEEKYFTNILTILILMSLNIFIMTMVHDYAFRAIMLFLNNIYLLIFVIDMYKNKANSYNLNI
jgi:hypothetical protein